MDRVSIFIGFGLFEIYRLETDSTQQFVNHGSPLGEGRILLTSVYHNHSARYSFGDDLMSVSLTFRPNPPQRPFQTEHADKKAREPEHNSHVIISEQDFQEETSNLTYL